MVYGLGTPSITSHNRRSGLLPMTFTVDTANAGSAADTFILPINTVTYGAVFVDWGDTPTATDTYTTGGDKTHVYTAGSGTYTVTLDRSPTFTGQPIRFFNGGDKAKITDITQWGTSILWDALDASFQGCNNMVISATDIPDFHHIANFDNAFYLCPSITGFTNSDSWDMSAATSLALTFRGLNIGNNIVVTNWDTSKVDRTHATFQGITGLTTLDISNWDTSSLTSTLHMFHSCTSLPNTGVIGITDLNVGILITALGMFRNCTTLTSMDLSGWNTTNTLVNISDMFRDCTSLTTCPGVSSFNMTNVTTAATMFTNVELDYVAYNAILTGWEGQAVEDNVTFDGGDSTYAQGAPATARAALIADHTWTITDGGLVVPMIFEIDTSNTGSATDTFILPIVVTSGTMEVDWGDTPSASDTYTTTGNKTHVYAAGIGTYTVTITCTDSFTGQGIFFNDAGDKLKITDITQWGKAIIWDSLSVSFHGCTNMDISATDVPDFKDVTTFSNSFRNCSNIAAFTNVNSWNVGSALSFNRMFNNCSTITTLDLSNWDVSSVTNFDVLVFICTSLTSLDMTGWDTSSGLSMNSMFRGLTVMADGGISGLTGFDVSGVTTMLNMFRDDVLLTTIDLTGWTTTSLTTTDNMFDGCTALTTVPGVNAFDVTGLTTAASMFNGVTLTTAAYDAILIGWEAQAVQNNVTFNGGNSTYTSAGAGGTARAALIADHTWTITDGGGV